MFVLILSKGVQFEVLIKTEPSTVAVPIIKYVPFAENFNEVIESSYLNCLILVSVDQFQMLTLFTEPPSVS